MTKQKKIRQEIMINFDCSKLQSFSVDNPAIDINYKAKIIKNCRDISLF